MSRRVLDALASARPAVSFEFFPPKDQAAEALLKARVDALGPLQPDFVSVTFGAGGGGGDRAEASIAATKAVGQVTLAARVAHLALAGQTVADLQRAAGWFLEAGVEGFMALRGDPPDGPGGAWVGHPGGLTYAVELVELLRQVTALPVGVAAFPHGHPTAPSLEIDARVLAAKQAAGADFAVTQVLFSAEAYRALLDRAERHGVTMPIVPGIMPITARSKVEKLELFSGAALPGPLAVALVKAGGVAGAQERVGLEWSVELVDQLLAEGAPGVHFYTLNSSEATQRICDTLGLRGALAGS
jgi:methylenetetrahydrofolate reductase (NADPH)